MDGLKLLTTAADGPNLARQTVWATDSGNEVASYGGHDDNVATAAISPDQRFAVTAGGRRNEIHVLDLANGKLVQKANGEPFILRGAALLFSRPRPPQMVRPSYGAADLSSRTTTTAAASTISFVCPTEGMGRRAGTRSGQHRSIGTARSVDLTRA